MATLTAVRAAMPADKTRERVSSNNSNNSNNSSSNSSSSSNSVITYISESAISFGSEDDNMKDKNNTAIQDDDDDWEDDDAGIGAVTVPGQAHLALPHCLADLYDPEYYDEHGNMLFKKRPVAAPSSEQSEKSGQSGQPGQPDKTGSISPPPAKPRQSVLSALLRQANVSGRAPGRMAGMSFAAGYPGIPPPSQCPPPQRPSLHPLRCHPVAAPPPPANTPELSPCTTANSSSSSLSSLRSESQSSQSSQSSHSTHSSQSSHDSHASKSQSCAAQCPHLTTMRIPQVAGGLHFVHRSPRALVDSTGPFTSMPFNGACGPRADPVVPVGLGACVAIGSDQEDRGCRGDRRSGDRAPLVRDLCRNGRLLRSELSSTLHARILEENSSRYIFRQYGSRRSVEESDSQTTIVQNNDKNGVPVRRIQSAPNVMMTAHREPRWQHPASQTAAIPCGRLASRIDEVVEDYDSEDDEDDMDVDDGRTTVVRGYVRDHKSFQFRKIEYVDDYVAPRSWSWGMDYHSKGW